MEERDYIEMNRELKKEHDAKLPVVQWVSVMDELPPNKNKKYLVIRDGEIEIGKWMYRKNGRGYWWNYLGITHWMQIPDPPCV